MVVKPRDDLRAVLDGSIESAGQQQARAAFAAAAACWPAAAGPRSMTCMASRALFRDDLFTQSRSAQFYSTALCTFNNVYKPGICVCTIVCILL